MKPYIRTILTLMCGAALTVPAAQYARADGSSPAYDFLNVTSSTRIYGLGGINITTVDDEIMTVDQNPALLGPEFGSQGAVNYMHYLGGSNFAGLRYGQAASTRGAWSAAIQYFGYGTMKETDIDGTVVGDISPKDLSFSGMYSHSLSERLRGGFNVKFLYSSYADYTAFAVATDLGINYCDPERDLSLSAVVANLGGQVKRFNETYDRLPVDVRLGWSQSFGTFPVRFSVTAWNLTRWHLPYTDQGDGTAATVPAVKDSFGSNLMRHLVLAADIIPSDKFNLGIGYNYKTRTDMSTYSRSILSGFSVCAGLKVSGCAIGVALAQPHTGATTMMVNLSLNINRLRY